MLVSNLLRYRHVKVGRKWSIFSRRHFYIYFLHIKCILLTKSSPKCVPVGRIGWTLQWHHNQYDGVPNHQPHGCLLNRIFRCRSKKTLKLRVTGLCEGSSPVTGGFPAQRASNAENATICGDVIMLINIVSCHGLTKNKRLTIIHKQLWLCSLTHILRHNDRHDISNHRRLYCSLNYLSRLSSKKQSKLRVTGLCAGNSLVTGEFTQGQQRGKCFHLMTSSCETGHLIDWAVCVPFPISNMSFRWQCGCF